MAENSELIYFLQIEVASESEVFDFQGLLSLIERNWQLKDNEIVWWETGFWSAAIEGVFYMGMGIETLVETLTQSPRSEFGICMANPECVMLVSPGRTDARAILLSIYASNEILPFAEVVEPFKKSVERFNWFRVLRDEILLEENLRRFWFGSRSTRIDPVAYIMDLKDSNYKRHPVVRNEFRRSRDPAASKIEYLTGTTPGGFIEDDYVNKRSCSVCAEIWDFEPLSVVEFTFYLD